MDDTGIIVNLAAFLSVVCLIISFFLILFFVSFYYGNDIKFGKIERWSIICIAGFAMSSIFSLIVLTTHYSHSDDTKFIGIGFQTFMWRFASICIFILFIKRVQFIFTNIKFAKYSIPKYIHKMIFIGCVILTKLLIIDMIFFGLTYYNITQINPYIITTFISYIIDTVLSIIIISSFMYRLKLIASDHGTIINQYEKDRVINNNNKYRPSMFQIFCRISILSTYCIISSKIYIIFDIINSFFVDHNIWFNVFTLCLLPIYCLINIVSVFLSFEFSNMWYYDTCNNMEHRCAQICSKKTENELTDLQQQLLGDDAL